MWKKKTVAVTLRELLEMYQNGEIRLPERAFQPWSDDETYRRFGEGRHKQIVFKCQACGLEFVILTLRTDAEINSDYLKGSPMAKGVTCPECRTAGESLLLGSRDYAKAIYEFVGEILRQDGTFDVQDID